MIVNEIITGVIAIIIGYLLGSIPSAYIAARLIKGKDIRWMGGGNVGARNTFIEVGKGAGIAVGIFDVGKGAAAVAIAHLLAAPLYEPYPFVLLAGLAVVVGHIWSIYLKFSGGNGLATTIGVLAILMHWELLIVLALTIIIIAITHNPVLSVNISLLSVPLSAAFLFKESWQLVTFTIVLLLILVLHFLPTARAALTKAGSSEKLSAELLRRDKGEKE